MPMGGDMPPMDGGMPPMDAQGGDMPPMDGGMPPMGAQGGDMPPMDGGNQPFPDDAGFDPGVEANEDTDPEKFIQQVCGRLSTAISKYLGENEDTHGLCKYVAKMITKQCSKGLDSKAQKELIDMIKTGNTDDDVEDMDMPEENDSEMPQDGMEDGGMEMPMNESMFTKKQLTERLTESFNQELDKTDNEKPKTETLSHDVPKSRFRGKKITQK